MTIPNLPMLDPFSPTFRGDVDAFFGGQIQATINAINPEIERINQIGAGSFTATSGDTLTVGTGTISLTIDTGKGFTPGQFVIVARTASPADFMAGQVVSYNAGTGAMAVNATTSGGIGTHSGWSVSIMPIVSPLDLDSIVVLTSGTSWTVPAGVRKVVGYVEGGSGSGSRLAGLSGNGGSGGGGMRFVENVTPGSVIGYSIGAGGVNPPASTAGNAGGDTQITVNGNTYLGQGGGGGGGGVGGYGAGNGVPVYGNSSATSTSSLGGVSAFGGSKGGQGLQTNNAGNGLPGRIILELYK